MPIKAHARSAIERLKAKRRGETVEEDAGGSGSDDDAIYDKVTEEEYKSIVRGRMMKDNFIEDDDGGGYVDDGNADEWARGSGGEEEEDDVDPDELMDAFGTKRRTTKGKEGTRKRTFAEQSDYIKSSTAKSKKGASSSTQGAASTPSLFAPRSSDAPVSRSLFGKGSNAKSQKQDDDFLNNIMDDLAKPDDAPKKRLVPKTQVPTREERREEARPAVANRAQARDGSPAADSSFARFRTTRTLDIPSSSSPRAAVEEEDGVHGRARSARQGREQLSGKERTSSSPPWDHEDPASSPMPTKKLKMANLTSRADKEDLADDFSGLEGDQTVEPDAAEAEVQSVAQPAPQARAPALAAAKPKVDMIDWRELHATLLQGEQEDADDLEDWNGPEIKKGPSAKRAPSADDSDVETPSRKTATAGLEAAAAAHLDKNRRDMNFYWFDYLESGDKLWLVGKVVNRTTKKYESCCVLVEGLERCLYVLPRRPPEEQNLELAKKVRADNQARKEREKKGLAAEEDDAEEVEDEEEPWQDEVLEEFDAMKSKHGISSMLARWVVRKYAFELPDVPKESRYLKVRYGFDEPKLPMDMSGKTFSHVFGTNTSAFELFVLKRKIMGPCWLKLTDVTVGNETPQSWCKLEVSVSEPKSVTVFSDSDTTAPRDTPTLNILSLSLRTVVNVKENKKEIICASTRVWNDFSLEKTEALEQRPSQTKTFVRALGGRFPTGFEKLAASQPSKITTIKYERGLINALLAHIHHADPDVIVGHELTGVGIDVLLHRMRDLKADHWSRIGRLRRSKWPALSQYRNPSLLTGRLICDLTSDSGKSMITSTTWSLTEMASTHLQIQRDDIDPDETASIFVNDDPKQVLLFLQHCSMDCYLQMAIAHKVQMLQVTKQLTNIAGNSWARTLGGGRAERNEYILLHDFHQKKYVCPDKVSSFEKRHAAKSKKGENDEDGAADTAPSKKDKFKGGLVFEPKRGLCDKFVLVMDFNSLYPSIIQEWNIDFTTVDRFDESITEGDAIPRVPSSDVERGILPALIAKLVEKRREVKRLMKSNKDENKQAQWDVKQLALKLTANSMYGCLGFELSRFYARPLAALTTSKGREILTETRELAESLSLEVIYGDTDSVMINTHATSYKEAMAIGNEFKQAVNKRYKLLEIDIDAVFERMLLLQKKKYAALKVVGNGDDGPMATTKEIKGLDMKRREYSILSKDASAFVLDQILSGEATENVVENIHDFLRSLGDDVRESRLPLDAFIIHKRLGKDPTEYPTGSSLPHVQVALRMRSKGMSARAGDVIPYVFCRAEGDAAPVKTAQADRAVHPDELRRSNGAMMIDFEYYLSLQVLPPIERLCDSIEGTEKSRLAECLGLDTSKYVTAASERDGENAAFKTLQSQIPLAERFKDCEKLAFYCPACTNSFTFPGIAESQGNRTLQGETLRCPVPSCRSHLSAPSVCLQLQDRIADHIARYYAGWVTCTDSGCGLRTRMTSVYARRCLANGCGGQTIQEYSDGALYTQLTYYAHLFDLDAQRSTTDASKNPQLSQALASSKGLISTLAHVVKTYLDKSGRKFVDLGSLFAGAVIM